MTLPVIFLGIWDNGKKKIGYSEHEDTKFKWKMNTIEIFREKLEMVGLQLDVFFKENLYCIINLKSTLAENFE